MKILILGAGQVGSALAKCLAKDNENSITIVDKNTDSLDELSRHLDIKAISGNASHPDVLEKAGIRKSDMLIAITRSDEANMLACQIAHTLYNVKKKIARIRTSEYLHSPELFSKNAIPIDFVITPEKIITNHLKRIIEEPGAAQIFEFEDGLIQLVETRAFSGTPIVNNQIMDLHAHLPDTKMRIVSVNRNNNELKLSGKTIIKNGDKVYFVTEKNSVSKVLKEFRRLDKPYKNIMIAGGGRIGFNLAKFLEKNYQVRVIEKDKLRCQKITSKLNNTLVLKGNASDEDLLLDEDIDKTDLFLALTDSDETNVIVSILAKRLGAHKVIALVKRNIYEELAKASGNIDMVMSPDKITTSSILTHIRTINTMMVHSMQQNKSEAIEIIVSNKDLSQIINKSIADIELPNFITIGSVVRDNEVFMPTGDLIIRSGDHILLIITDTNRVREIEKFFANKK